MRLKLDENLPHDLTDELARRGNDVDTVLDEQLGGRKDPIVVQPRLTTIGWSSRSTEASATSAASRPGATPAWSCFVRASQDPVSILELVDRLLDVHELEEFGHCVVIVEPRRIRVRRPNDPDEQ